MNARTLTILTIAIWSTGVLAGKLLSECSVALGLLLTTSFALVFLAGLWWRSPQPKRLIVKPTYVLFGITGSLLYYLCFIQAFKNLPSTALAGLLNYTWPVFTVVFTDLCFSKLRKSPRQRLLEVCGIMLGFGAVALALGVSSDDAITSVPLTGVLWGLGAGVSYGVFGAFSSTVPADDRLSFLINAVAASWIGALSLCLVQGELMKIAALTLPQVLYGAYNGIMIDGLGERYWTLANQRAAEQRISIARLASLVFFLPLLSLLVSALVLGEDDMFHSRFLLSLGLLITGSVICEKAKSVLH